MLRDIVEKRNRTKETDREEKQTKTENPIGNIKLSKWDNNGNGLWEKNYENEMDDEDETAAGLGK